MTLDEALAGLKALGSETLRAQNARRGVAGDHFGVKMGDIRTIAKEAKADHALAIGETLGVYRDYSTSPGCTSPFAPIWIHEMVRRQG